VQKLTRRDVDELLRKLRAGGTKGSKRTRRPWGARSCNLMLGIFSQVLDQLVRDGTLVRNVVEHVDRVPGKKKQFSTYTPDQVAAVLAAIADDRDRHAWHLALSGLRRGEIAGLRWADVDLDAKTLKVWRTRVSAAGKAVDQEDAKSAESLPDPLLAELKAARKRQAAEKLAIGAAYADLGYVVCNEAGEPYRPDTLSKMWAKAIAAADVPRIRLHDARHTCGTIMHLYDHVPPATISAWLGHADVAFTMRTYVHSQPDALAEAAQSLARVVTIRHNVPAT
jgi:integrase